MKAEITEPGEWRPLVEDFDFYPEPAGVLSVGPGPM